MFIMSFGRGGRCVLSASNRMPTDKIQTQTRKMVHRSMSYAGGASTDSIMRKPRELCLYSLSLDSVTRSMLTVKYLLQGYQGFLPSSDRRRVTHGHGLSGRLQPQRWQRVLRLWRAAGGGCRGFVAPRVVCWRHRLVVAGSGDVGPENAGGLDAEPLTHQAR